MKKKLLSLLLMLVVAVAAMADVTYSQDMYEKAVMGDREAMYNLSLCYMQGMGIGQDFDKSDYWLERAAQLGQPSAVAAIRALEGKTGLSNAKRRQLAAEEKRERERLEKKNQQIDYTKYNDALVKKAQSGDAKAQISLGECYYFGNGVSQDYTQAVYWFRKAAEQGYASAQNNLGWCYQKGNGVPKDYTQAVYWYRKAAEQGNATAQNNLAVCYHVGNGDYTQAVYWYRKAADQGFAKAQYNLGLCYEYGKGVTKDVDQAIEWYRKAARQGDEDAQKALKRLGYSW